MVLELSVIDLESVNFRVIISLQCIIVSVCLLIYTFFPRGHMAVFSGTQN